MPYCWFSAKVSIKRHTSACLRSYITIGSEGIADFLTHRQQEVVLEGILWLFVGPTGVYLLDFFCSGIQFNLLLSPYPCFISLLYLDLYVLGDDALIS